MKKLLLFISLCFPIIAISQIETKVDSADKKLEKLYNKELTDSQRVAYKKQIDDLTKFINRDSSKAGAYLNRGAHYSFLGLFVKAIDDYNKAIEIDSTMAIAYFNRGIAKARFRYTVDACLDFKKAYDLGLDQSLMVYDKNCGMYHKVIAQWERKKATNSEQKK